MTPKDAFGVVVRVLGMVGLYYGVYGLISALYMVLFPKSLNAAFPGWYVFSGFAYVGISLYLVRGAPGLLRFAYPHANPPAALPLPPNTAGGEAAAATRRNPWDAS